MQKIAFLYPEGYTSPNMEAKNGLGFVQLFTVAFIKLNPGNLSSHYRANQDLRFRSLITQNKKANSNKLYKFPHLLPELDS
jgi:hypothetical protein